MDSEDNRMMEASAPDTDTFTSLVEHKIRDDEWLVGFHGCMLDVDEDPYGNEGRNKIVMLSIVTARRPPTKRSLRLGHTNQPIPKENEKKKQCLLF